MSTSSALTLTNNFISTLQGVLEAVFPAIFPTLIVVMVLFVAWFALKGLYHRGV